VQSQAVSLAAKGVVLATSSPLRSIVVLIVEDEFLVRLDIAAYLRDCGFTVFEADTADEAITLCRTGVAPDVLLTDINLNGSANGWDVAEEFRALWPGIGVVYTSGNSLDRSRRVPDSLFFNKPYLVSDVADACRHLMSA
jgi:CheY-like chemotaxis protein